MILKRLLIGLLILLAAAGAGYAWRWQQAQDTARAWTQTLRPFGILRSASVWPSGLTHPGITLHGVSFEPTGAWQKQLKAPIAYRILVDELRLTSAGDAGTDSPLRIEALGVSAPLLAGYDPPAALRTWLGQSLPTATDLQISSLNFDASLEGRYTESSTRLQWTLQIQAPRWLALYWQADVTLPLEDLQQAGWARASVNRQTLEISDLGYFAPAKELMAARARMDVQQFERTLAERLQETSEADRWAWSARSAQAAQSFIAQPKYLKIQMDPLHPVALPNLSLYAPGDLFGLFNLSLNAQGEFDHPAPGASRD